VRGKGVTRHGSTDLALAACFMSAHDGRTAGVAINLARTHARRVLQEVKKCGDRGLLKTERERKNGERSPRADELRGNLEKSRAPCRIDSN